MSTIDWQEVPGFGWAVYVGDLTIELTSPADGEAFGVRIVAEEDALPLVEQTTEAEAKDAALDIAIQSLRVALRDCERVRRSSDGGV
jgi:hypothetical protein